MRRIAPIFAAALLAAACAALDRQDAPGCQGVRRPANPNGSVLAPGSAAPSASTVSEAASGCAEPRP